MKKITLLLSMICISAISAKDDSCISLKEAKEILASSFDTNNLKDHKYSDMVYMLNVLGLVYQTESGHTEKYGYITGYEYYTIYDYKDMHYSVKISCSGEFSEDIRNLYD